MGILNTLTKSCPACAAMPLVVVRLKFSGISVEPVSSVMFTEVKQSDSEAVYVGDPNPTDTPMGG